MITTEKTVWCDRCNTWTYGDDGPWPTNKEARAAAKREGWTRRGGKDYCPICSTEMATGLRHVESGPAGDTYV